MKTLSLPATEFSPSDGDLVLITMGEGQIQFMPYSSELGIEHSMSCLKLLKRAISAPGWDKSDPTSDLASSIKLLGILNRPYNPKEPKVCMECEIEDTDFEVLQKKFEAYLPQCSRELFMLEALAATQQALKNAN